MENDKDQLLNMHEIQKMLGKSRSTIYAYMRQGMPHEKKGRNIFFRRDDVNAWYWQFQVSSEYQEMTGKAKDYFAGDPLKQIQFLKKNASWRTSAIGMAEIMETCFNYEGDDIGNKLIDRFYLDSRVLKNFSEGLLFAMEKVDTDDYDFLFILNKMDGLIEEIIRQRYIAKYGRKKFKTYWGTTLKTIEEYDKEESERYNFDGGGFFKGKI